MPAHSVVCYVLENDVSVVSNLSGQVVNVICPEYSRLTHACRLKERESGISSLVFRRVVDRVVKVRTIYCEFAKPRI